jgi:hypothetical protein
MVIDSDIGGDSELFKSNLFHNFFFFFFYSLFYLIIIIMYKYSFWYKNIKFWIIKWKLN